MKIPNRQSSFLFCLCFCIHSFLLSAQSPSPRFWVSPASVRADFWQMFAPGAAWDTLRAHADVFSLHVNALRERDTASMRVAAKMLRDAGVKVNIECGGLRPFSGCDSLAGERHAQLELSQMLRWTARGGNIDFITMDSPINTMIMNGDPNGTCNWTVAHAASEMIDYMKAVRARIPSVTFALVEPVPWYRVGAYPNHPGNDYGDLLKTLDTVLAVVASRGERIDIFHSDSPYEYSENTQTQGWLKIKAVEDYLHARGIRHGRISNSQEGGFQSDQLFYDRTLASFDRYKSVGGAPDEVEVWCWYDHPTKNFPEQELYTFSYTCNRFFEKAFGVQPPKTTTKFEPPDGKVYHGVGQSMTGVNEYITAMGDSTIHPIVWNFYYDIPGTRGDKFAELRTTLSKEKQLGRIPHLSIAMTNGPIWTDSLIATGTQYDYIIDSIAAICKQFGRRMFVRPGFEFNGWWFPHHPYLYPKAFQKIVDRFRMIGAADSAAFLWCYYPAGPNDFDSVDTNGARWYPGDDYVDWFSLDLFPVSDFHLDSAAYKRGQITAKGKSERFLAMARAKSKPVFLSEVSAAYAKFTTDPTDGMNDWNNWFVPFWNFLTAHPEIKGFNYTNWDWSKYGQWKEWGDARIEVNSYILTQYKAEMRKSKYIHLRSSKPTPVESNQLPRDVELAQNYPNPFSESTTIRFQITDYGLQSSRIQISEEAKVCNLSSVISLKLYDLFGREVLDLTEAIIQNPSVTIHRLQLPKPGVYFYRLTTPTQSITKGMVMR